MLKNVIYENKKLIAYPNINHPKECTATTAVLPPRTCPCCSQGTTDEELAALALYQYGL